MKRNYITVFGYLLNPFKAFRWIQNTRIENIIAIGCICIGFFGLASPSQKVLLDAFDGKMSGLVISNVLSGLTLAFGIRMFGRIVNDSEMKILVSPIMLYAVLVVMSFAMRPDLYRYSPVLPVVFVMLAWIIMSYTLSPTRVR